MVVESLINNGGHKQTKLMYMTNGQLNAIDSKCYKFSGRECLLRYSDLVKAFEGVI